MSRAIPERGARTAVAATQTIRLLLNTVYDRPEVKVSLLHYCEADMETDKKITQARFYPKKFVSCDKSQFSQNSVTAQKCQKSPIKLP